MNKLKNMHYKMVFNDDIEMSLHSMHTNEIIVHNYTYEQNEEIVCVICLESCLESIRTECCDSHIYIHNRCKETFDSMYNYEQCIICRKKTLKPMVSETTIKNHCLVTLCNMITVLLMLCLFILILYIMSKNKLNNIYQDKLDPAYMTYDKYRNTYDAYDAYDPY